MKLRNGLLARTCLALSAMVGALAAPALALQPSPHDGHEYELPLPANMVTPSYRTPAIGETAGLPGWERFTQSEGRNWIVGTVREDLDTPAALYGPGIPMVAADASQNALSGAAQDFVARHADMLKANPAELTFSEVIELSGLRQVNFQQTYEGLEVLGGRVELYTREGRVVFLSSEFFPGVSVVTTPAIGREQAQASAISGLPGSPKNTFDGAPRLVVYPLSMEGRIDYYLAYEVKYRTESPAGWWWSYVDASDGDLLTRQNFLDTFDIPTTVTSDVHPLSPFDAYSEWANPNQRVRANSTNFYTDDNGFVNVTVPNNQSYTVTASLDGLWANANKTDGVDASLSDNGTPNVPLSFHWTDANSSAEERDAYYFVNKTHEWITTLDPSFTGMDFAVSANLNLSGTCNAFWNGSSVNFYPAGGGCQNTGRIATVIEHEYGHGISQYTYSPSAPPNSSGMGEGFSDIVGMDMENTSCLGKGFTSANSCLRSGMNQRQGPGTECGGEPHCLGEIFMGCMWKTRVGYVDKYGLGPGGDKYRQNMRTAWKTKQYSFTNYLNRLLLANDDNGDLGDGTPDYYEICDAWAVHNIDCPAITKYVNFVHTPLVDQVSTVNPYPLTAVVTAVNSGSIVAGSVKCYYSVDGGQNYSFVTLTPTGNANEFGGSIPAQSCGSLVYYYLYAQTTTGISGTNPNRAPAKGTHLFMTGAPTVALNDNFESNLGWTVGNAGSGDAATDGVFQRADPVGKANPNDGRIVQPEDDHTTNPSVNCYVTNPIGGFYINGDVDAGCTAIYSPTFNWASWSGAGNIEFWAFFDNEFSVDDTLTCEISNDGGGSWSRLIGIRGLEVNDWNAYKAYFSSAVVPFTNNMKFRFRVCDFGSSLTEAAVDDVVIRYTQCASVDVNDPTAAPAAFDVAQNYPNPFREATQLSFALPKAGYVSVEVYDAGGRLVRSVAQNEFPAGSHSLAWDGRDAVGRNVGAGVYYYRVRTDGQELSRKMLLVK